MKIPCVLSDDKEAIQFCIRICAGIDFATARVVRIPNTSHIGTIMLSESYYRDAAAGKYSGLKVLDKPAALQFDSDGFLKTKITG
jgi:hypothetical protein